MARFQDDQAVYAQLGRLFEELLADPRLGDRVRALGVVVQFKLLRPDSQITLNIGEGAPGTVEFGITQARPAVSLLMDAETAHRFWAGELALNVALSEGRISAKGPVATILKLVPLVKPASEIYARITGTEAGAAAADEDPAQEPAAEAVEPDAAEAPEAEAAQPDAAEAVEAESAEEPADAAPADEPEAPAEG
ncbi:unannotated protein [freshwater metagenome]|jgi:hypothetical protein|uniref:Unannotated protein n=1 Tax=freshwater metagenome TaxID=449393 RepID=A0A6J7HQP8_9ZZZZ|nr:hypothetical protein [Actinomycetota bacterium]